MTIPPLFEVEGRPVARGDVLYHRDVNRTGGRVTAEFPADGEWVTVRSTNGAVPSVRVTDLSWECHPEVKLRRQFLRQARDAGMVRTTEREFEAWMLGRESAAQYDGFAT